MQVNEATGEVTGEIGGETFKLHATLPRVAAFQAALGIDGFPAMFRMVQSADARAVYQGVKTLCSSGNAKLLDAMVFPRIVADATTMIVAALAAGLPEDDGRGKENGTGDQTQSPGPATVN